MERQEWMDGWINEWIEKWMNRFHPESEARTPVCDFRGTQ